LGNFDSQIHLHSLNAYDIALNIDALDVLTCEYASNQKNTIPKRELEKYDKFIRVGVSRTNIDSMISDQIDKGHNPREFETEKGILSIIDSSERIQKRYKEAISLYGDRLKYVGPDCGLKSWNSQRVAFEVLHRTVEAIKSVR
jgi:5-methyltetrahydropteroyltriglutamate--homocysteine methyltransferase